MTKNELLQLANEVNELVNNCQDLNPNRIEYYNFLRNIPLNCKPLNSYASYVTPVQEELSKLLKGQDNNFNWKMSGLIDSLKLDLGIAA